MAASAETTCAWTKLETGAMMHTMRSIPATAYLISEVPGPGAEPHYLGHVPVQKPILAIANSV